MIETSQQQAPIDDDPYIKRFLHSPVYVMVFSDTMETAASSYRVARRLK